MFTDVDVSKVRTKRDPGRCFIRAGFKPIGIVGKRKRLRLQLAADKFPTPEYFSGEMVRGGDPRRA